MLDPNLHARCAERSMDAFAGYTKAAAAAYSAAFGQAIDVWADAVRQTSDAMSNSMSPDHRRRPTPSHQQNLWSDPFDMWHQMAESMTGQVTGQMTSRANPMSVWTGMAYPAPSMPNPFQLWSAWTSMSPWQANPIVWPMVVAMMSYGVPREVAVPTAEANAAALDAAESATQSVKNAFSSYRSEGGHASAQMMFERMAAALLLGPMALASMPPWAFSARPL